VSTLPRLRHLVRSDFVKKLGPIFLGVLGAIWLLIEFTTWAFPEAAVHNRVLFLLACGLSLVAAMLFSFPRLTYAKYFPSKSVTIELVVGDILDPASPSNIAVLSSDYFDSCAKTAISPHSVVAKLIASYFSGKNEEFDSRVDESLLAQGITGQENPEKVNGRNRTKQYPIGTTAAVSTGIKKAFIVVGTHFDDRSTKTTATPLTTWVSLHSLWSAAAVHGHRQSLSVPLWGAHLGNAPGNRLVLFQTLLCSFASASATMNQPPTSHLQIFVWKGDYRPAEFDAMRDILENFEM